MEAHLSFAYREVMRRTNISAVNPVACPFAIRAKRSSLFAPSNDVKDVFDYVDFFNNTVR